MLDLPVVAAERGRPQTRADREPILEQEGLCVNGAPRANVEDASARAQKMLSDIRDQASKTQVFTGEIESKGTMCPQCGKPAGEGKFCTNCGANLSLVKCEQCGTDSPAGTRFCSECG